MIIQHIHISKRGKILIWVALYTILISSIFFFTQAAFGFSMGDKILEVLSGTFQGTARLILSLGTGLYEATLKFTLFSFASLIQMDTVRDLWSVFRDATNIFIVVAFLITAFGMIVGKDIFGSNKKAVLLLLGAALVVNFSALIVLAIFDISNVISVSLYNLIGPQELFFNHANINELGNTASNEYIDSGTVGGIVKSFIFIFVALFLCIFFFAFSALLVERLLLSFVLLITSPLVVVLYIGGKKISHLKDLWGKWKNALIYIIKMPPILIVGMYVLLKISHIIINNQGAGAKENFMFTLIGFLFLFIGLFKLAAFLKTSSEGYPIFGGMKKAQEGLKRRREAREKDERRRIKEWKRDRSKDLKKKQTEYQSIRSNLENAEKKKGQTEHQSIRSNLENAGKASETGSQATPQQISEERATLKKDVDRENEIRLEKRILKTQREKYMAKKMKDRSIARKAALYGRFREKMHDSFGLFGVAATDGVGYLRGKAFKEGRWGSKWITMRGKRQYEKKEKKFEERAHKKATNLAELEKKQEDYEREKHEKKLEKKQKEDERLFNLGREIDQRNFKARQWVKRWHFEEDQNENKDQEEFEKRLKESQEKFKEDQDVKRKKFKEKKSEEHAEFDEKVLEKTKKRDPESSS